MTMKIVTMRHATKIGLFAAVVFATCAFAASANAQSISAKFNLPYEVHWGKTVLPAGAYTISMDSLGNPALVRSATGKTAFFAPIPVKDDSHKGATALFVLVRGNQRVVRSLNLPEHGISLIYQPATSAEREMLTKADQIDAVPVTSARK
jgi:hypothetical protein